jgi:hypothetical protein
MMKTITQRNEPRGNARKSIRTFLTCTAICGLLVCAVAFSGCRVETSGPSADDVSNQNPGGTGGPTGGTGGTGGTLAGAVTQGAVQGAAVFADHLTGAEADHKMNADEAVNSSTTAANGAFSTAAPLFAYVITSIGGTDTITNQPAMHMLAPSGARGVSPFTTMNVLNTNSRAAIESLGIGYDTDLSTTITPAAALLVHCVQATVSVVTGVLNPNDNTLPTSQVNAIQRELLTQIARQIEGQSVASLTTCASLATTHQTAALNTLTGATITGMTNLTIGNPSAVAAGVAQAVNSVCNAIAASNGSGTFSTTTIMAENTIITPAVAAVCNSAYAAGEATAVANGGVVVTAPANAAPVISGTPRTTTATGAFYNFSPTASDADGDVLLFSIVNKPSWASFSTATGALGGTPSVSGVFSNIVISVSDGMHTVALPAFTVTVGTTGSTGGTGGTFP